MRTIEQLLTRAEGEARSGGERLPGPEHLLLAAAALPDGSAARALERAGVDPQQLRPAIQEAPRERPGRRGHRLERGVGSAGDLRGPATDARALSALGVDREQLRAAARVEVGVG